jgi:hypothetical protein
MRLEKTWFCNLPAENVSDGLLPVRDYLDEIVRVTPPWQ